MELVAIDIGNTNTKIARINLKTEQVVNVVSVPSAKNIQNEQEYHNLIVKEVKEKLFHNKWEEHQKVVANIFLISVVPQLTPVLVKAMRSILAIEVIVFRWSMLKMPEDTKCGQDMIMFFLGAFRKHRNFIAISLGTANVCLASFNAQPQGIVIAPGFQISQDQMQEWQKANTKAANKEESEVYEKATRQGLLFGQIGQLEKTIQGFQEKSSNKKLPIIITGGNYYQNQKYLQFKHQFYPNVLFDGMVMVYQINCGSWKDKIKTIWQQKGMIYALQIAFLKQKYHQWKKR